MLRADRAVLHVINLVRQEQGLDPITAQELLESRQLRVSVSGGPETYEVTAWNEDREPETVQIQFELLCQRAAGVSRPVQLVEGDEQASWSVTRREDAPSGTMQARVTRLDTEACYRIYLPPPKTEWDITACNRGIFNLAAGFIGTETRVGAGDPAGSLYVSKEPQDYRVGHLGHAPGRDPYPVLNWDGLSFHGFFSRQEVPDERTRLGPYVVSGWVRGEVTPDHERIAWVEVGERHLARYSRPGRDLVMWRSNVYLKEWVWRAEDLPLVRTHQPVGFRAQVSRDDTLAEQGLISAYYRTQTITPYWPAQHHIDQGTTSFSIIDVVMEWPGAEYDDTAALMIVFELADDWWD